MLAHDRRQIMHVNVTGHPTAQWTAQQIRNAFPWDTAPRYLLRDQDGTYGPAFRAGLDAIGIEDVRTASSTADSVSCPAPRATVAVSTTRLQAITRDHLLIAGASARRRIETSLHTTTRSPVVCSGRASGSAGWSPASRRCWKRLPLVSRCGGGEGDRRLVACNDRFREFYPNAPIKPGLVFEDLTRYTANRGLIQVPGDDIETWVTERVDRFGTAQHDVLRTPDGRWLDIRTRPADTGELLMLYTDTTQVRETEATLSDRSQRLEQQSSDLGVLAWRMQSRSRTWRLRSTRQPDGWWSSCAAGPGGRWGMPITLPPTSRSTRCRPGTAKKPRGAPSHRYSR